MSTPDIGPKMKNAKGEGFKCGVMDLCLKENGNKIKSRGEDA
jgi:hypothetical protein